MYRLHALILSVLISSMISAPGFAAGPRLVTQEDLSKGPAADTITEVGHTGHKIPRYWDNNAFTDNLTLYGNDLITKGPWVDVRWKGAVCDGSTDDTTALLLLIAAVEDTAQFPQPPEIRFPSNKCVISSVLNINRGGLTFRGTGKRSGIRTTATTQPGIYATGSEIAFVNFLGEGANTDVSVGYNDNAPFLDYNASGGSLRITNSLFWHMYGDGVKTRGGIYDTVITGSDFKLNAGNGFNSTNGSQNGNATTATANKFSNNGINGFVWGSASGLDLSGNTLQGDIGAGAYIKGALGARINGNYTEANDNGMLVFDATGSSNIWGLNIESNYGLCKNNAGAYVNCINFVGDTDNAAQVYDSKIGDNYFNSDVNHSNINGGNILGGSVKIYRPSDSSFGTIDNLWKAQIIPVAKRLYLTGGQKIAGTITYSTSPNLSDNLYSAGTSTIYLPLLLPNESFIEHVKVAIDVGTSEIFDLNVAIQRMAPSALDPYSTITSHDFTSQTWGQKSWTGINLRMEAGYNYILKYTFSNMGDGGGGTTAIRLSDTEVAWD